MKKIQKISHIKLKTFFKASKQKLLLSKDLPCIKNSKLIFFELKLYSDYLKGNWIFGTSKSIKYKHICFYCVWELPNNLFKLWKGVLEE